MEMMEKFLLLLVALVLLILAAIELVKEVKSINKIKPTFHDDKIKAIVVGFSYVIGIGRKLVLEYSVDGIEKKYVYHFFCDWEKYPEGKEVTLKLSKQSRLAYSRADLIKAFLWAIFEVLFLFGCVVACLYAIFFKL